MQPSIRGKSDRTTLHKATGKMHMLDRTLNIIVTLKSGSEVTQGHSKWYHSKAWVQFLIRIPQQIWLYLVSFPK